MTEYRHFAVWARTLAGLVALAGLIGQHNDGPWGGLPEWLGSASWFGFLIGVLATIVTGIYWAAQSMRARGGATGTE